MKGGSFFGFRFGGAGFLTGAVAVAVPLCSNPAASFCSISLAMVVSPAKARLSMIVNAIYDYNLTAVVRQGSAWATWRTRWNIVAGCYRSRYDTATSVFAVSVRPVR